MRTILLAAGLFFGSTALAQPPQVATGQDLTAWQRLEARRLTGTEAVEAYRAFVVEYDGSELAVAAWGRLVALQGAEGDWRESQAVRDVTQRVERAWRAHERALAAHAGEGRGLTASVDGGDDASVVVEEADAPGGT